MPIPAFVAVERLLSEEFWLDCVTSLVERGEPSVPVVSLEPEVWGILALSFNATI